MRITLHHEARRAAVQAPHRCVACGYQGTASGSVSWRLRRAFGLPMRVFQVETELTCPGCGARAVRLGGVRGQPPARDRFGGVVLFGALAMVPIVVWIAAMPPASVDATARQRLADSEAELFRGYAERDRYRVQLAGCEVAWRQRIDAIAGALATGPEIPLAAADEARLLAAPVIAANHQSETLARHYASWDQSTRGPHCASRVELEPHMGPELDPRPDARPCRPLGRGHAGHRRQRRDRGGRLPLHQGPLREHVGVPRSRWSRARVGSRTGAARQEPSQPRRGPTPRSSPG